MAIKPNLQQKEGFYLITKSKLSFFDNLLISQYQPVTPMSFIDYYRCYEWNSL